MIVRFLALSTLLLSFSAQSETLLYTSAGEFERDVVFAGEYRGMDRIVTNAATVALASEVTTTPVADTALGNTLTFLQTNTGLSRDYVLSTLESGAGFTFDDVGSSSDVDFDHALSVGDISDDKENDDWSVTVTEPIRAFGVLIKFNTYVIGETLSLYDQGGNLLDTVAVPTSNIFSQFVGVITDFDFYEVRFNESFTSDDTAIANLRFPARTEIPPTRVRDQYGISIDMTPNGNTAVIGARGNENMPGLVFVHERGIGSGVGEDWVVTGVIASPDGVDDDNFGSGVAISADGNTVVVTAPTHHLPEPVTVIPGQPKNFRNAGAAYVFYRHQGGYNNWGLLRKLSGLDRPLGPFDTGSSPVWDEDRFGQSLSMDTAGSVILIGSPLSDVKGTDGGLAYEFARNQGGIRNWGYSGDYNGYQQPGDWCGFSVAVSGDGQWVAVGCVLAEAELAAFQRNDGTVWMFPSGGSRVNSLQLLDLNTDLHLGESLQLNDDGTVLAAGTNENLQYFAIRSSPSDLNWDVETGFAGVESFSSVTAMDATGEALVVGAYADDRLGQPDSGSARIYYRDDTRFARAYDPAFFYTLPPFTARANVNFGIGLSLSADGSLLMVGAPKFSEPNDADSEGEVIIYNRSTRPDGLYTWEEGVSLAPDAIVPVVEEVCVPIRNGGQKLKMVCL